jgi:hypothetical protein
MEHLERSLRQNVESGRMETELFASPMLIPTLNVNNDIEHNGKHFEQLP